MLWIFRRIDLPECGRSFAYQCRAVVVAGEFAEHRLKILGLAEIAIHRGEAHIGDVVELAQMLHHDLADGFRRNLRLAAALQLAHDRRHHLLDPFRIDLALAQGNLQRAHQLVAIERHAAAVALDHRELAQLHPLKSGEAEIARDADPQPPDHRGILGRTRVLYLRIETVAAWAAHDSTHLVIPGCALLGADPESSAMHCSGFRVRAEEARPGMTVTAASLMRLSLNKSGNGR